MKEFKTEKKPTLASLEEDLNVTSVWLKKTVWQEEKDFPLEVPVNLQNDRLYCKRKKSDIPDENLLSLTN